MSEVKYLYIDDENDESIDSLINGFNDLKEIYVEKMPITKGLSFSDLKDSILDKIKSNKFQGLLIDLRLDGTGPDHLEYSAISISSELRSIAARKEIPSFPIVLCSTIDKIRETYNADKTSQDLFDYTFKKGERIGIVGKNGVGKSTFLKIALRQEAPDSGKINHGDTVLFGHFSQEGLQYKEDKRAIEFVKDMAEFFPLADGSKISASQFMQKFGFTDEQQYTPLSKLSGGEKRRLHLLSILFRNPNFLILDEPTNDLDLQTLRTLEEFLLDFPGCILIVSHDRYFMDRMVDHLFVFEGNGLITDFPGNYTQYRQAQATDNKNTVTVKPKTEVTVAAPPVPQNNTVKKLSFKEKYELENIEQDIPKLQEEKKILEGKLMHNMPYEELQKTSGRIAEIIQILEEKEIRWLVLSERLP